MANQRNKTPLMTSLKTLPDTTLVSFLAILPSFLRAYLRLRCTSDPLPWAFSQHARLDDKADSASMHCNGLYPDVSFVDAVGTYTVHAHSLCLRHTGKPSWLRTKHTQWCTVLSSGSPVLR